MQHSLALSEDGRVFAWGAGHYGALGLGRGGSWVALPLVMPWLITSLNSFRSGLLLNGALKNSAARTALTVCFRVQCNLHTTTE
jgi:hypothetical protein